MISNEFSSHTLKKWNDLRWNILVVRQCFMVGFKDLPQKNRPDLVCFIMWIILRKYFLPKTWNIFHVHKVVFTLLGKHFIVRAYLSSLSFFLPKQFYIFINMYIVNFTIEVTYLQTQTKTTKKIEQISNYTNIRDLWLT